MDQKLAAVKATNDALLSAAQELRAYQDRMSVVARQHRRKSPVRDVKLQDDFRASVAKMRAAVDNASDAWQDIRRSYNAADNDKADFVRSNRIMVKQLKTLAMTLSRQCDDVYTSYQILNSAGKDLPLRLNWWLFDSCCADLLKISGSMLFLTRDMEKYYE